MINVSQFRFFALVASSLCLSGCVLWPTLDSDPEMGSSTTPADEQAKWTARNTTVDGARQFATAELQEMRGHMASGDHAVIAESYILAGMGIATGYYLSGDHSHGPVKSLALAAAGILGLDAILKPREQQRILQTGTTQLQCALAVDNALGRYKKPSGQAVSAQFGDTQGDLFNIQSQFTNGTATLSLSQVMMVAQLVMLQQQVLDDQQRRIRIEAAAEDAPRAAKLTSTVIEIHNAVADALRGLIDPSSIQDVVKRQYANLLPKPSQDGDAQPRNFSAALAIATKSTGYSTLVNIKNAYDDDQQDAAALDAAYKTCLPAKP